MSIADKRVEHAQSTLALFSLLQKIRCNPSQFSQAATLINALKSQGALAKYKIKRMQLPHPALRLHAKTPRAEKGLHKLCQVGYLKRPEDLSQCLDKFHD